MYPLVLVLITLVQLVAPIHAAHHSVTRWAKELKRDLRDLPPDLDLTWETPFSAAHVSFTEFCHRPGSRRDRTDEMMLDALDKLSGDIRTLMRFDIVDKYVSTFLYRCISYTIDLDI
jgi:hypothetical protein